MLSCACVSLPSAFVSFLSLSIFAVHSAKKVIIKVKASAHYSILVTTSDMAYEDLLGWERSTHILQGLFIMAESVIFYLFMRHPPV